MLHEAKMYTLVAHYRLDPENHLSDKRLIAARNKVKKSRHFRDTYDVKLS